MREYVPDGIMTIPKNAKRVFEGKIFDIYQWPQKLYDGTTETFEMLRRNDTVNAIGVNDGKIVITHQKQPRKDWFYDFPGGRHDNPDENELAAAKREMLEETGMSFRSWKLVRVCQPYLKMDWLVYTFIATDFIEQVQQNLDGGEQIEVVEVSFEELKQLAHTEKRFTDNEIINNANSLDDLLNLPALHKYN